MERITPRMMNDFMLELAGVFAVKTVKKEFGMVCAVFNAAVKLGVIERNPGMGVELLYIRNGKVIRVRGVVLTAEDQIVPVGTIAKVTRHKTNTALTLFLEQTERN